MPPSRPGADEPRPAVDRASGQEVDLAMSPLLARAFSAAPNGFVVVDTAGSIVAANAEMHRMFGYPQGGLIGGSVDSLLPEAAGMSHAALRAGFLERPEPRPMGVGRVLYARRGWIFTCRRWTGSRRLGGFTTCQAQRSRR
jgi:PAS domain S-box-containing protein